jgi:hypothetical protein
MKRIYLVLSMSNKGEVHIGLQAQKSAPETTD